jgi:tetratricopeptide (TPR) repeat protein
MRFSSTAALMLVFFCCGRSAGDLVSEVDTKQYSDTLDSVLPDGITVGKLLKDSPDFQQAIAAFRQGKIDEALQSLEKTQEAFAQLPPSKVMLAILFMEAKQAGNARAMLEQAHQTAPNDPTVYRVFGDLALAEARLTDAYVHFDKAWRLASVSKWTNAQKNFFRRHCVLGMSRVHESRGDWKSASRYLKEALKIEPGDADALQRLARALFSSGKSSEAYEQLRIASQTNSELEPPELMMARFAGTAGDNEDAEGWLRKALESHPSDTRGLILYASWLLDQGRANEAWTQASAAAAIDSDSNEILLLLGTVSRFLKQNQRAEQYFERVHRAEPANFQASNQLAQVLVAQDDATRQQRALQLAEINVRQYPQLIEALSTLGWVYFRVGRIDEAEQALSKAMSAGRSSSDTAYFMASVLATRGRTEDARKLLTGSLEASGRFLHREEAQAGVQQLAGVSTPNEDSRNE